MIFAIFGIYRFIYHFNGSIAIVFLDVGQGDSILIKLPEGKQVLIDGGPDDSVLTELSLVNPYLLDNIDYVFVTHTDNDHFRGIYEVNRYYTVKNYFINLQEDLLSKKWRMVFSKVVSGQKFILDNVEFEVLWPPEDILAEEKTKHNNKSIVLKISYGNFCAIFSGDIESEVEKVLVEKYKEKLDCDLLKVPHHGSDSSSTEAFIDTVTPKLAVISVGKNNVYNHPSQNVIERYKSKGVTVWRTDLQSRLMVKTNGRYMSF